MNSLNWVIYLFFYLFFFFRVGGLFFIFYFLSFMFFLGGGGHLKFQGAGAPPRPPFPPPLAPTIGAGGLVIGDSPPFVDGSK